MIELSFNNLWIEEAEERLPLSQLSGTYEPEGQHIHGELVLKIDSVQLPYMGYFGDDDVCFNTWLYELIHVSKLKDDEVYTFDEGEQGQPAYKFQRSNNTLFISIVHSLLTGEPGDLQWENKSCDFTQFKEKLQNLVNEFSQNLKKASPSVCEKWLLNNVHA